MKFLIQSNPKIDKEKYNLVKKENNQDSAAANEIRVTNQGVVRNYVSYAITQLEGDHEKAPSTDTIVIKGMKSAISRAVSVYEQIRHKVKGIYSTIEISSQVIEDEYVPKDPNSGLKNEKISRRVVSISIIISKKPLDKTPTGFSQEPISDEEVTPDEERGEQDETEKSQEQGSTHRGRGQRGGRFVRGGRGSRGGRGRGNFRGGRGNSRGSRGGRGNRGGRRGGFRGGNQNFSEQTEQK